MDVDMPRLDGLQTLAMMQEHPKLRLIPVLMISGMGSKETVLEAIRLGAVDFLNKPYDPMLLRARLANCLEKKRLRDQEREHLATIERQRIRTRDLLLNVLPRSVAETLLAGNQCRAVVHEGVGVLFIDLVDFSRFAVELSPVKLVRLLECVFERYDTLVERHGLEKIKTVGDAYLVAGGVPDPHPDALAACASLALDMVAAVADIATELNLPLQVRLGLDTGPVVAGIIGRSRFGYDLWGEAVNRASRMESNGVPGRIQVTDRVKNALSDRFEFELRGSLKFKGCGEMTTWFLVG
jgi:class 3 adenylate cyclase